MNRPSSIVDQHVVADGAVDPGALEQVRRRAHAHAPAARGCRPGRRRRPGSRRSRRARRASGETPVGLRTNSIAVGMPAAARMPASWPAAVGMTGQSPPSWSAAIRRVEVGVERHGAGHRLGRHRQRGAVALGPLGRLPRHRLDQVGQRGVGVAAGVEPRGDPRGHGVGAVGLDLDPAEGGPLAGQPGLLVGGQRGHRVGEHRVVPVLHAGGARVVGLAGEVEAVAPVRPDLAGHARPPRRGRPGRGPARRAARRSSRSARPGRRAGPPSPGRARPPPARRAAPRPRGRAARARSPTRTAPTASREPRQARPEARALLLGERRHDDRPRRARSRARAAGRRRPARRPRPAVRRTPRRRAPSRGASRSARPAAPVLSPAGATTRRARCPRRRPRPSSPRPLAPASTNQARSSFSGVVQGWRK